MPEHDLAPPRPTPSEPEYDDSAVVNLANEQSRVNVARAILGRFVNEVLEPLGDRHLRLPGTTESDELVELAFELSVAEGATAGDVAEDVVRQLAADVEVRRTAAGGADVVSATVGGVRIKSWSRKMSGRVLFRCPAEVRS